MRPIALTLSIILVLSFFAAQVSADYKDDIGYTELLLELGGAIPNGSGVGVSQTEAAANPANSPPPPYDYLPDTSNTEFSGKTLVPELSGGAISGHATLVGQYYYGNSTSVSPGITGIHVYEADAWIGTGFLNSGTFSYPNQETQKVENNSWIGSTGSGSGDIEVLRRFDYSIQKSNNGSGFLAVSGLNNGSGTTVPTLMGNSYNGLVVGLSNGNHSSGQTTIDGSGRIKPDIVCLPPDQETSFATPVVGAAGALLWQKALSDSTLSSAQNSVELKAVLMAGATKTGLGGTWSRPTNSTQPMDLHYGAGQLNIYNSYHILVAGKQTASTSVAVRSRGWNYTTTTSTTPQLYFFNIAQGDASSKFSAVLIWNRLVANTLSHGFWGSPSSTLPNLFLALYTASGFTLDALVDSSVSTIDNVQLLYQPSLPPGSYALAVSSTSSGVNYGLAWYSLPTVNITATTPDAYESRPVSGLFTITRAGETTDPLTVNCAITGTATNGTDYTTIPASVTIPAASSSTTITITPNPSLIGQGDKTVTFTLSSDFAYSAGAQNTATVTIHDTPFNEWRFSHFTQSQINDPSPGNITTGSASPASDGIVNLIKYALNLDPFTSQTTSLPPLSVSGNITPQFTFQRNLQATDITLTVEACNDLTKPAGDPDGWQTIASLPSGASSWTTSGGATVSDIGGAVIVTDGAPISAHALRFFRLQVTLP